MRERDSSIAVANWSGHEVDLTPHLMPLSLMTISSALRPSTIAPMPFRLPLQPPVNSTELTLWLCGSMSKEIDFEQVPCVLY